MFADGFMEKQVNKMELKKQYVSQKCFDDISKNTTQLIEILNHRMTQIENDVNWIKILGYWMAGMVTTIVIKLLFFA